MKVQVDYSHYVIVDVPDSIITEDEDGLHEFLKTYVPEGAEVHGWEYPIEEEE
jgi:hypothetical protein